MGRRYWLGWLITGAVGATLLGAELWLRHVRPDAAGIDTLLVDEGGAVPRITLAELGHIAPVRLKRVARSDNFIRDLLPAADTWTGFFQSYQHKLDEAVADGAQDQRTFLDAIFGFHQTSCLAAEAPHGLDRQAQHVFLLVNQNRNRPTHARL